MSKMAAVPRISGRMNERERAICLRVLAYRDEIRWSQKKFASNIGISRHRLANIERCYTPLRYQTAWIISFNFGLGLEWFAGESAPPPGKTRAVLPIPKGTGLPKTALFSEVFERFAGPIGKSRKGEAEKNPPFLVDVDNPDMHERVLTLGQLEAQLRSWIARLPDDSSEAFYDAITKFADSYFDGVPEAPAGLVKARLAVLASERRAAISASKIAEGKKDKDLCLTETASGTKLAGVVKDQWPALKRRLQQATAEAGQKSTLATFLGVDLTRVSQWLTEAKSAREPGAEYALQMQYWVDHPEVQK